MKAIMISIKPKWCAKIMNGEKTIEIRKTMPKCELPIDVYIYCTKEDSLGRIKELPKDRYFVDYVETPQDFAKMDSGYDGKGKVVAKFTLNKVEEITYDHDEREEWYDTKTLNDRELENQSCLTYEELGDYLKGKGYAIYISDLEIFDKKPKELSEFYPYCKDEKCEYRNNHCSICYRTPLTKAPRNFCYVEVEEWLKICFTNLT